MFGKPLRNERDLLELSVWHESLVLSYGERRILRAMGCRHTNAVRLRGMQVELAINCNFETKNMSNLMLYTLVLGFTALTAARCLASHCGTNGTYLNCQSGTNHWCCPTANGGYCGPWVAATPTKAAYGDCKTT
jgi:hypothetical protein